MKKYRLLKDMPSMYGTLRAGEESRFDGEDCWIFGAEGVGIYLSQEFIDLNPEFFEEVKRWKPELGEDYYYFDDILKPHLDKYFTLGEDVHMKRWECGNCFKPSQTEHARDEIKKLLLKLREDDIH